MLLSNVTFLKYSQKVNKAFVNFTKEKKNEKFYCDFFVMSTVSEIRKGCGLWAHTRDQCMEP